MPGVVYFLISRRFGDRDAPRRPLSTLTEDDADLRGRFKDTVFVDKVDLRNKLRDATAPEGIDLYVLARSFVGSTIQPLFSEADVLQSGFGQILSGVFSGGVFGSSKPSQVATVASPPRPRQPSTPSELPRSSTTPKTALQGSVRSRDPKSKKPAARPLAKRAYAYVDRLRGASKYLDADDNARLVEEGVDRRVLLKQVRRSVVWGCRGVSRPTKFHLEWCRRGVLCHAIDATLRLLDGVRTATTLYAIAARARVTNAPRRRCELKARTLYYTRRDPKSGDSIGFTKKLRLGTRAYEARFSKDEIALRSLALKVTEAMLDVSIIKKKPVEPIEQPKKKAFRTIRKEITLRAADLATAAQRPSLDAWWALIAPGCPMMARGTTSRRARRVARHSPSPPGHFLGDDTAVLADEDFRHRHAIEQASRRCVSEAIQLPPDRGSIRVHGVARAGARRVWRVCV